MMRIRIRVALLFCAFLMVCAGCVRNEVKVEFKLPANVNDAYRIVFYASDKAKGFYLENVAAVQGGKGESVCPTRYPTIGLFIQGSQPVVAGFYAERGDRIVVKGENSDPAFWTISGNKITEEWSGWRTANRDALISRDPAKINKAVSVFVSKNSENPLSTILLLIYYDRRVDPAGFRKAWKKLAGEALEPKWISMVATNDMMAGAPAETFKPGLMVLKSAGMGADTLRPGKVPMILYCWRREDTGRTDDIAMLKSLVKDFPDSAKRVVADICFEPDSGVWRSAIRMDSLERTVRAWNPLAEIDSVAVSLGITGTPRFVVIGKKGETLYNGAEREKAKDIFNKEIKQ